MRLFVAIMGSILLSASVTAAPAAQSSRITKITSVETGILLLVEKPLDICKDTTYGWMFVSNENPSLIDFAKTAFMNNLNVRVFTKPQRLESKLYPVPGVGGDACHLWQIQLFK